MNTRLITRPAHRLAAAAFGATLVLGVAACGDETDEVETATVTQTSPTEAQDDQAAAEDDATATDDTDAGAEAGADNLQAALQAISTAEDETGGTAYEIDDQDDDGTWEVDVRVDDRSVEVTVSADGNTVEGTEDDDLDDDDRAGLDAAQIPLTEAIENAIQEAGGGMLDDAELSEDDGNHFWEVTVDGTDRGDDIEVKIDVTNGQIIGVDE